MSENKGSPSRPSRRFQPLTAFLGWCIPNVVLSLLQLVVLYLSFWLAARHVNTTLAFSNCVLLFYSSAIMGNTCYTIFKKRARRRDVLLRNRHLAISGGTLMCIVVAVTTSLYVWNLIRIHDQLITFWPVSSRQIALEVMVVLLVIPFAFYTSEKA